MKKIAICMMVMASVLAFSSCGNKTRNSQPDAPKAAENAQIEAELDTLSLKECQNLYEELLSFTQEKEFQAAGLAGKQRYIDWTMDVKSFAEGDKSRRLMKSGIVAGDLRTLADLYVVSKGKETKDTESLRRHFEAAFAPNPDLMADGGEVNQQASKNIIGKWDVSNKFVPEVGFYIEIYEQDGTYFAYQLFKDGSSCTEKLRKDGNKYHITGNNNHEYYMIKSGMLRICGLDGDFTEANGFSVTRK